MATKQVQSFEEYVYNLPLAESDSINVDSTIAFLAEYDSYLDSEGHTFKRVSFSKMFKRFAEKENLITGAEVGRILDDGKYVFISEEAMGNCINGIDTITTNNYWTNGVCFPEGINFGNDSEHSFIGWSMIDPGLYGVDADILECNVCYGTFGMDTVYIKDLYVKNLHTAESSSSGGSSSAYIPNVSQTPESSVEVEVDQITAKNYPNIIFGSGITFHGNPNYSLIKYGGFDLSPYNFGGRGNITTHECCGSFTFGSEIYALSGLYTTDVRIKQDDGTMKSLKETISKLEARIAALEAK